MGDIQSNSAQTVTGARVLLKAPYKEQDPQEVAALVRDLDEATKAKKHSKFSVKKSRFSVKDSPQGIHVDSWKFNDWDYKRRDLPTYARGLFTSKNKYGEHEIAVRGYDKFFNTNEVKETEWSNIEERTRGPYELTLKENGCIIFISALADDTLIVCSKHSTGAREDIELSHSSAGEKRIESQLAKIGKTKEDLARDLRARNATAVAELCDDEFEEHILAYGPDKAGLYLHGINLNLPEFRTYPSELVQDFAKQWGFHETELKIIDTIAEVRQFLESVAETGAHDGRDVEGFVVRCQMSPKPDALPYSDWFFKYKFEEPYLMYRQWRECTKALISGKPARYKKHIAITEEYLLYARKRIAADPNLARDYNRNHGIIQLRNEFLEFKNLNGADAANFELQHGGGGDAEVTKDVILVPIATIGCGKTTIAVALGKLLGYGHIQNDNITGTKRPPRFTRMLLDELETHPAVIADRNNAQRHERKQLLQDVKQLHLSAKLVALNFVHDDINAIRKVTHERVFARGDHHQTIHAQSESGKVVGIMEGFLGRYEPLDLSRAPDDGFDSVVDLDPTDGSRVNVEKIVRHLHQVYPGLVKEIPSAEAMDAATEAAIASYTPAIRHNAVDRGQTTQKPGHGAPQPKAVKKKPLEYIAVHVDAKSITVQLQRTFDKLSPADSRFYMQLQQTRRIQSAFHVTLMHRMGAKEHPDLWARYLKLQADAEAAAADKAKKGSGPVDPTPELGQVDVQLERVVYDDRLMALVVRLVDKDNKDNSDNTSEKWICVNKISHITVGTRDSNVKPKESNDLLARWLREGSTEANGIRDVVVAGKPLLAGSVRGVLSR